MQHRLVGVASEEGTTATTYSVVSSTRPIPRKHRKSVRGMGLGDEIRFYVENNRWLILWEL